MVSEDEKVFSIFFRDYRDVFYKINKNWYVVLDNYLNNRSHIEGTLKCHVERDWTHRVPYTMLSSAASKEARS
jgi:hypothetical protein